MLNLFYVELNLRQPYDFPWEKRAFRRILAWPELKLAWPELNLALHEQNLSLTRVEF